MIMSDGRGGVGGGAGLTPPPPPPPPSPLHLIFAIHTYIYIYIYTYYICIYTHISNIIVEGATTAYCCLHFLFVCADGTGISSARR